MDLGAILHGTSHVDRDLFLSLVYFLVAASSLLEDPAQLVRVGGDSKSLLDHSFDLSCVHVDVQIEPYVFPVEKNDLSKNTFLFLARRITNPTLGTGSWFGVLVQRILVPTSGILVSLVVGSPVPSFVRVRVVVTALRHPSWSSVHRHRCAVRIVLHLILRPRLASCRPVGGLRS